ncbi:hypothetical protein [Sphingobium sp. SCG-1]|uniref:hypothetical protein n=1 Tax=Sphingobium sp. SCG-1 TaxID=2072936 RepID=UPI0011AB7D16|nr:hypothetical protein [Sphingobium sp. SCG-1]
MRGVRGVLERGVALGERAAVRRRAIVLAEALEVRGVRAGLEGDAVVIEGRALLDRWVEDARLLYIGRGG